ncbi:MAG: glycosyltransferase family 4 protein, partial [Bacteroidota bacterium]
AASTYYENEVFDVIHAHDWMGITAGLLAKSILKIPLVAHIHSIEADRNGAGGDRGIREKEQKGLHTADAIICVSNETKQNLINTYQIDADKVFVIPNATRWKVRQPKFLNKNTPKITFMGRLTHQKSPGKILDLARELENGDHLFQYEIIGDGYLKDQLMHTAAQINLSSKVDFAGFQEPDKLKKRLKESSLVVVPSVSEPFGLVAIEATAMGIPVMISEGAGVNEYIPFRTFRHWDLHGMKKLALQLISDKASTLQYVQDCQAALKKLKWSTTSGTISKLYKMLVEDQNSGN